MEFIKEFKVTKDSVSKVILTILNFQLKLSDLEVDMLSVMLSHNITKIDAATRVLLRDKLDKTKFDINNYIKRLKEKKLIIIKEDKSLHINPNIVELMKFKTITFKLKD